MWDKVASILVRLCQSESIVPEVPGTHVKPADLGMFDDIPEKVFADGIRKLTDIVIASQIHHRLALTINFKTSSPLLAESLDKMKPVPPNLKGRRPPEMTMAQDTLSRLTYYHRLVFRDEIRGRVVEWRTHWLSGCAELGKGPMLISLEERILPHLKLLKNYLARRSFTARFTSQYSVRLCEWAWQHRKAGLMRLSVDELREILGVSEEKDDRGRVVRQAILTHWPNLKQRALARALNEITTKSDRSATFLSASASGEGNRDVRDFRFRSLLFLRIESGHEFL